MPEFDYDMIARYAEGEMSMEERIAFEELIEKNESLKNEVALFIEIQNHLKQKLSPSEKEKEFRDLLIKESAQHFNMGAKLIDFRSKRFRWVVSAIAVAAIVLLFIWAPWQESLFEKYATIEMPSVSSRGAESDSLMAEAVSLFNQKKYSSSSQLLHEKLLLDSSSAFTRFYYGAALVHIGDTNALPQLQQLYTGNSAFKYDAAYFIALYYLKEKNYNNAKEWLQKIPVNSSLYSKASELLKKIDSKFTR